MSADEALQHLRDGRAQHAADLLQLRVVEQPGDTRAWFLLGAARHGLNDLDAAAAAFSKCISLDPADSEARLALVAVLRAAGKLPAALGVARDAVQAIPGIARLHYAAGLAADELGLAHEALACYDAALDLDPALEDAMHNRGVLLLRAGRVADALDNQGRYLRTFPGARRAHSLLIDVLIAARRFENALEAIAHYESLAPGDISTPIRRGVALSGLLRYDEARAAFSEARARDPDAVLRYLDRIAPNANPDQLLSPENVFLWQSWMAMGHCDWSMWSAAVSEIRRLSRSPDAWIDPAVGFMALHLPLASSELAAVSRRIAMELEVHAPAMAPRPPSGRPRLRVGIISPDLREHIVGYLLLPLFELLDRRRFELYAYSLAAGEERGIRAQLRVSADHFRDLDTDDDDAAASCIAHDDLDILIDVAGYTTGNRAAITARRPARVQVLYHLGHAGPVGSSRIDYAIVDRVVARDTAEWSEKLVYLPNTYYLYDFRQGVPGIPLSRSDYGLPEHAFVYCAFHKPEKISPDTFQLWARALRQAKQSVLWLAGCPPEAQQNLRREAGLLGVAPARLVFAPFEPRSGSRYLARHRLGDLMLDALHHNAIATACDALSVGLPVMTLSGSTMASRSGESLLRAAGVPELVFSDKESYVAQAVRLASDTQRVYELRRRLLRREAPLFDTAGRVRELETALEEIWAARVPRA